MNKYTTVRVSSDTREKLRMIKHIEMCDTMEELFNVIIKKYYE